jgi:hypothetical protein
MRVGRERKKIIRQNIRTLRSFCRSNDVSRVYAVVDNKEVDQAAMFFASKYGRTATATHIEDGTFDYCSNTTGWSSYRWQWLNTLVYKMLFGFEWSNVSVYGTSKYIDEVYGLYPNFLRPELQSMPCNRISPEPLQQIEWQLGLQDFFNRQGISNQEVRDLDALLLVPSLRHISNDQLREPILNLHSVLLENGLNVGIKYHPRESPSRQLDLLNKRSYVMPRTTPLELIYIHPEISLDYILGNISTALVSVLWILDDIEVGSYYSLISDWYDYEATGLLIENFEKLGITDIAKTPRIGDIDFSDTI